MIPNPWTHYDSWLADDGYGREPESRWEEDILDDEDPAWEGSFRDELHGVATTSAPCAAVSYREVGL